MSYANPPFTDFGAIVPSGVERCTGSDRASAGAVTPASAPTGENDRGGAYEPLIRSGEGDPSVTPDSSRPGLPWLELSLPRPPSVNRFMTKLGNKSPIVQRWIKQADMAFVLARTRRRFTHIIGHFEAEFEFERGSYDLDNRIKPLLDFLQRVELIQNDRLCERLVASWGPANSGVVVRLRPWMSP